MAIPMTCAGCKASFDVPDSLAGKTIRCTSCKAQMTVPEALVDAEPVVAELEAEPASGSGEKKPFGFGAGAPAATKAPPKPALAKSETKTDAKTSPAKPAAKAAVVAEADDEDEDEDEKAKPARSGEKKSASFAGKPKKRRDDDDDDEDDDKPAKKKRKNESGASGAMIGIIAAGALGLAAIAGGCIYLLSGDDTKPEETTQVENTNQPGSDAPGDGTPDPGNPKGPRPGPGGPRPGPGGSKGPPGGGIVPPGPGDSQGPVPGDVDPMPGGPGPRPGPGGPRPGPGGPRPGNPGGGFGGNPFARFENKDQVGTPGAWATYTGDGFTAEFPGTPEVASEQEASPVGAMKLKFAALGKKDESAYVVMGMQMPFSMQQFPGGGEQGFLNSVFTKLGDDDKVKVGTIRNVTVNGYPGKEADVEDKDGKGVFRVIVAKNRVYFIAALGQRPAEQANTKRFLDSVKLTYKGDDQIAGLPAVPGGGLPGLPQNPGGSQGPPPVGPGPGPGPEPGPGPDPFPGPGPGNGGAANADGNLKAQLDPFMTAAFDTEQDEIYTLEPRQVAVNRYAGTLRRYDAKTFQGAKGPNKFDIPHVGFRAAIDPKAGLLYVAYATNPALILGQHQDRASTPGSIAVYDLKPLRTGKTADGKVLEDRSDIKPLASISVSGTLQGMELSDDGKSLYVLASTGSVTKRNSYLLLIDTEKRQVVRDKRKDLPEAARDLVKSPDGKRLIVIEDMTRSKSSGVLLFDIAKWVSVRSVTFRDSAVLDVAPLSDGGLIVSAAVINQPAGGGIGGGEPGGIGVPGPGGPGGRPGGIGGGQPGGGQQAQPLTFKHILLNADGDEKGEMVMGNGRAANDGYVEFDPANKKLFASSFGKSGSGLDVFEVTDPSAASGLKLKSAIRTAKGQDLRGHFLVSPDGKFLVFHSGLVIETSNVGGTGVSFPGGGGIGIGPSVPPAGGGIVPGGGGIGLPPGGGVVSPMPGGRPGDVEPGPMPGGGPVRPAAPGGVSPPAPAGRPGPVGRNPGGGPPMPANPGVGPGNPGMPPMPPMPDAGPGGPVRPIGD